MSLFTNGGDTNTRSRKAYTEATKGWYVTAFSTKIKGATAKDMELTEVYAIDLVSKYHKIAPKLLRLEKKQVKTTTTSIDTVYYIKVGKMVMGKLAVSVQQYPLRTNILFVYRYKSTLSGYRQYVIPKDVKTKASDLSLTQRKRLVQRIKRNYRKED